MVTIVTEFAVVAGVIVITVVVVIIGVTQVTEVTEVYEISEGYSWFWGSRGYPGSHASSVTWFAILVDCS